MKTCLTIIISFIILSKTLFAAGYPAKQEHGTPDDSIHKEVASFNTRVEYARSHGELATYSKKGGLLACSVYSVKTGPDNGPGYTLVVAKDQSGGPLGDIVVLSNTVAIDPEHSIKCSGHVLAILNGSFMKGGEDLALQLGLRKGDGGLKITGQQNITQIN